jgi:hypothetical protein
MYKMLDDASPCAKSHPVVFTFVITAALAAAVLTGASLSGVASGAMRDVLRNAGFGRNGEILEQRHQTLALERIEVAVGRMRDDIALLHARFDEAGKLYQGAVNVAVVNLAPRDPAPSNPASRNPSQSGPVFHLSALRASLDADALSLGARAPHPHPRRVGKGGPDIRI